MLRVETRASQQLPAKPDEANKQVDPNKPLLIFNLPNGKTFREGEEVVIDFSLANAKLKGDGGDYRVRYIVDDDEMQWIDRWEQVVLTGWTPGKHTIRLELIGPDGWPYRNGDYNIVTRELTVTSISSELRASRQACLSIAYAKPAIIRTMLSSKPPRQKIAI